MVKLYNLCLQIIQTQTVLLPFYMHFQDVAVALLRCVTKDLMSSLISRHKHYDFNAANFGPLGQYVP